MTTQINHSDSLEHSEIKSIPVVCYCGSTAHLDTNAKLYNGREYGNGKVWLCDRWPVCEGSVGTHPDGKPLGSLIDRETRKSRRAVHAVIDPLWQNQNRSKKKARGSVYGWLCKIMSMQPKDCHVGLWDAETCERALKRIANTPYQEHHAQVIDLIKNSPDKHTAVTSKSHPRPTQERDTV